MSAHYALVPLEPIEPAWLVEMGLVVPDNYENSRNPSAAEVRSVVKHLLEESYFSNEAIFQAEGNNLVAWLNTNGQDDTLLRLEDYGEDNNEGVPRCLSFTYGSYEIAMVVCERLAHICGPFLLLSQGGSLIIIDTGTSLDVDWVEGMF